MDSLMLVELQLGLEKQFGIVIPSAGADGYDDCGEARATHTGIAPALAPTPTAAQPVADPAQRELSAEPELVAALGRLLEDDLDRAKERAL
jgi:hypothetical protein